MQCTHALIRYNRTAHMPLKSAPSRGGSKPLIHVHQSAPFPQTASRSIQLLLHSSPVCPSHTDIHTDRHTDHTTCDICSNRPHLCTTCKRCGLMIRIEYASWKCMPFNLANDKLAYEVMHFYAMEFVVASETWQARIH